MPEIILEISLNRSSGVLAGIVASLAQAGIELKSQKLQRATESRGGWLTVVGSGDSPEPAVLSERLAGTRGIEQLMRVIVDGEAILAEGRPLDDQIRHGDLAELSAGSETGTGADSDTPEPASITDRDRGLQDSNPDIEDLPILSEPEPESLPQPEHTAERDCEKDTVGRSASKHADTASEKDANPVEPGFAGARGQPGEAVDRDEPAPDFSEQPTAEGDLAEALHDDSETARKADVAATEEDDDNPGQVGAILRRRRRRRR